MLGAVIGDVIGSVFENENVKSTSFDLFSRFSCFTDDTVLTVAIADAVLNHTRHPIQFIEDRQNRIRYASHLKAYGKRFPNAGYGELFKKWLISDSLHGYGSYGNGAAMRVSPIGFAFETLDAVLHQAKLSASVSHNHPDGIKGAQAVASAVFLARAGETRETIRTFVEERFGYNLHKRLDDIRPQYTFDSSCSGSVPQALIVFLESDNFEDAIRKAVSLGGDSDTIACMTGGIAHAYYKQIPEALIIQTNMRLEWSLKQVIKAFNERFGILY